ncbi:MAG: shikimate kinase [Bacteroidetes bacterium]|nr:shikimate kinase [Bacteroidota bacterium]MCB0842504.1 shikimate kinase [Bacteroidota bacterium]
MILFLIGFMGAGKSTLGKMAARQWNWTFIDLDDIIESREGKTIPEIFSDQGEDAFRHAETEALKAVDQMIQGPTIIAAGGGTPCFGTNMEIMNQKGITVYLKPDPETLIERLWYQKDYRPMIKDVPEEEFPNFIKSLLAKREESYQKAEYTLEDEQISVSHLANIAWN